VAALLVLAGLTALLAGGGDPITVVRPPPRACGDPADSDAWMSVAPTPETIPCSRLGTTTGERNLRDRGRIFTYQGSTLALDGRHRVYAVFVDVGLGPHQAGERSYVQDRIIAALGWVARHARTFEGNCINLDMVATPDTTDVGMVPASRGGPHLDIQGNEEELARAVRAADPLLPADADTLRAVWQKAMDVHKVTSVSFLFLVPWDGRSYAVSQGDYDYTVLFMPPDELDAFNAPNLERMIAHEFFHLAGADDLYDIKQAASWELRSLMNIGCLSLDPGYVDPYSSFGAGLGEGYERVKPPPPTPFPVDDDRGTFVRLRP
jgi:hypothetical protein